MQGSVGSSGLLRTGCEGIRNRPESSALRATVSRRSEIPLHHYAQSGGRPRKTGGIIRPGRFAWCDDLSTAE
jgi:hypothetical protein